MCANSFMPPAAADHSSTGTPWLLGGHMKQDTRRIAERHAHARGQIFGIESGVMAIRTEHAYWLIGPGQCLWLPPPPRTKPAPKAPLQAGACMSAQQNAPNSQTNPFSLAEHVCSPLWQTASPTTPTKHDGTRLSAASQAECFWHEFLTAPRVSVSLPFPKSEKLYRVANTLSHNPADLRDQKDWAELAAMSLRSFVRHFTLETGLPFSVWRQRLRILNAQEKLARGESVASVALDVGYESLGAFATAFHKNTGYRPSDYARLCRTP